MDECGVRVREIASLDGMAYDERITMREEERCLEWKVMGSLFSTLAFEIQSIILSLTIHAALSYLMCDVLWEALIMVHGVLEEMSDRPKGSIKGDLQLFRYLVPAQICLGWWIEVKEAISADAPNEPECLRVIVEPSDICESQSSYVSTQGWGNEHFFLLFDCVLQGLTEHSQTPRLSIGIEWIGVMGFARTEFLWSTHTLTRHIRVWVIMMSGIPVKLWFVQCKRVLVRELQSTMEFNHCVTTRRIDPWSTSRPTQAGSYCHCLEQYIVHGWYDIHCSRNSW